MTNPRWSPGAITQVTRSNFTRVLQQIRKHIQESDYIAVSSQKTGGYRRPWHRVLPFDSPKIAYLKSKLAAETYEIFQFAVCPFRVVDGSKVVVYPYNFHLFPRDELNTGMPSYSFSCQASFLTSMAKESFDFNACIYDGISYLSRVQESKINDMIAIPRIGQKVSSSSFSPIDKIFMKKIESKVQHWKNACKGSSQTGEGALLTSLRKLMIGSELFGSRPCLNIDICSQHQVQLVMKALDQYFDDIVPIVIPNKDGEPKVVCIVLTCSEADKNLLISEVQHEEEEHSVKIRGFRGIIDLMASSNKPIIAYGCLNEFAFIHSKFIAPLPPSITEFICSLRFVFGNIIDVDLLLKEIGPLRKATNLPAAISYLRRQFFVPADLEIPQDDENFRSKHGHNVLRVTQIFAKVSSILNISPSSCLNDVKHLSSVKDFSNIFTPCCTDLQEQENEDIEFFMDNAIKVRTSNFIFLWGFREGTSAGLLKALLHRTHGAFSEDFQLKLIDTSCAVVIFDSSSSAKALLDDIETGNLGSGSLRDLVSDGLKAAGYDAYKRVCESGIWDADLADSLEKNALDSTKDALTDPEKDPLEIYWPNELNITSSVIF